MHEKVVVITGATSGIGEVAARSLAEMGASVLLVSRNQQKTSALAEKIRRKGGKAIPFSADLSSRTEVKRVARQIKQHTTRVDVLLNNAGAIFMSRHVSVDGLEMTFALNHLNYFVLTHELMDLLHASSSARVVNVSSAAHLGGHVNFDDLRYERSYFGWRAYSASKLMNILFTYELSRRISHTGITVNALHPGFVATNFGKSNGGVMKPVFGLAQIAARSPEEGAQTSIYLSSSPEVEGVTGQYFCDSKPVRSSPESYDLSVAARLWEVSEALTE